MDKTILITGGAGFIGSHLADELLEHGYHVRVLDHLSAQVRGQSRLKPSYLDSEVELLVGDVRKLERHRDLLSRTHSRAGSAIIEHPEQEVCICKKQKLNGSAYAVYPAKL